MAEEILRLPQDQVKDMVKKGSIEVVTTPKVEPVVSPGGLTEKARLLFGEDFLGEEAIRIMEEKCQAAGITVEFEIPRLGAVDTSALQSFESDKAKGRERLAVLRPEIMIAYGQRKPITILNLRELFGNKNAFGDGRIFYRQTWYNDESFAKEPQKASFAFPTKEILPDSLDQTWIDQRNLLEPGERRREAVETLWDSILYYAATGKKILKSHWDWGETRASDGRLVCVGLWASDGLDVVSYSPDHSYSRLGVCPSR